MHTQLVDADPDSPIREILVNAGCEESTPPDIVIVCVHDGDITTLREMVDARLPIVAVCDEADIDLVFAAGVAHVATRPVRNRELLGRIRAAMRAGNVERKLSDAILELTREKQTLERLVCIDALTGVANRRHVMDMLAAEWKRSAREGSSLALVMVDLDCFHNYNDHYGHLGGDACLQRVAEAMTRCLRRPSDVLGRYGGEEFVAVLPNTDEAGAKNVADSLRAAVESLAIPHATSACAAVVTVTAGFAAMHARADQTMEQLIAVADAGLLRAKHEGRNRSYGDARAAALPCVA